MREENLLEAFRSLPPEAQRQVTDFVAFLQLRYSSLPERKRKKKALSREPFIGMWRDREEMRDGLEWVRHLRQHEWG